MDEKLKNDILNASNPEELEKILSSYAAELGDDELDGISGGAANSLIDSIAGSIGRLKLEDSLIDLIKNNEALSAWFKSDEKLASVLNGSKTLAEKIDDPSKLISL